MQTPRLTETQIEEAIAAYAKRKSAQAKAKNDVSLAKVCEIPDCGCIGEAHP